MHSGAVTRACLGAWHAAYHSTRCGVRTPDACRWALPPCCLMHPFTHPFMHPLMHPFMHPSCTPFCTPDAPLYAPLKAARGQLDVALVVGRQQDLTAINYARQVG